MQFIVQKRYREGIESTEKVLEDMSKDSSCTALDMALARFMVISAMHTTYPSVKAEPEETAKIWRTKQLMAVGRYESLEISTSE